jgi:predicted nucleic acid-binding Zn ribbon protein
VLRAKLESRWSARRSNSRAASHSFHMQRAARFIKNKNVSRELLSDEDLVRGIWSAAVGKAISSHTKPSKIVRGTLIVEVEDAIWRKQLHILTSQIVDRVQKLLGNTNVSGVEFRVAIPRRQPGRVELPREQALSAAADEADRIEDPVLKRVYQISRKKATA